MSATRATGTEYRLLSQRSASVVCRCVQRIQMDLKSLAGAVPVRWTTGETLTDIVVKFSGDPAAFLLLCLNQLAAYTR